MQNYQEICEELISNKIVSKSDIYDYVDKPYHNLYNNYFEYCQRYLSNYSKAYNIEPARFYFPNYFEVNAFAQIKDGYFLIGINMGTILETYLLFYEQNNFFEEDQNLSVQFKELSEKINIPMGFLMFQLSTLFTFHHELAHLVQNSPFLDMGLAEQYDYLPNQKFDIEKHILEFDSDIHGADAICIQLLNHFKKLPSEIKTDRSLVKLLAIGVASIYSYFLLYFNMEKEIYYAEYSHPHPLIRMAYVIHHFLRRAREDSQISVIINPEYLAQLGFEISNVLFKSQEPYIQISEIVQNQFIEKFDSIENYINDLLEQSRKMKNLLMNRI